MDSVEEDKKKIREARDEVDKAIKHYIDVRSNTYHHTTDTYVVGWACYAEYFTNDNDFHESQSVSIVPDEQHATMSRGMFEMGADAYRWVNKR